MSENNEAPQYEIFSIPLVKRASQIHYSFLASYIAIPILLLLPAKKWIPAFILFTELGIWINKGLLQHRNNTCVTTAMWCIMIFEKQIPTTNDTKSDSLQYTSNCTAGTAVTWLLQPAVHLQTSICDGSDYNPDALITWSALRQVRGVSQSEFSRECDLGPPL